MDQKIVFSGIQPSGTLHLGNYVGSLRNWPKMQADNLCYACIVDMHAITVAQDPATLRQKTLQLLAGYLAVGLDPEKCVVFVQSHVSAHAELAWVLNCETMYGEARRMTQFKEKCAQHPENVNLGLLAYPSLMAADILLYQADFVPVGADQKQHMELARDLAVRFNNRYSPTFTVPEPYIPEKKDGARVMSLQDPTQKMSKSDGNENATVALFEDDDDAIARKFKRAVTDSGDTVRYAADKPGVSNLLSIYSAFTGMNTAEAEGRFAGKGYGDFKLAVADAVIATLSPMRKEYTRLLADKPYLMSVLKSGADKANRAARKTLAKVYKKVGFIQVNV
ncbi:MAG: tryptophan--tRNA ligase [Clostridiales bacterium]|jgi:tryptophanyl-tRNA synthetase|nr:tryptophan--tRNA ligase [Clostridiales bacterium]